MEPSLGKLALNLQFTVPASSVPASSSVILMTQLTPSSTYPIRRELRVLTYQAIVD